MANAKMKMVSVEFNLLQTENNKNNKIQLQESFMKISVKLAFFRSQIYMVCVIYLFTEHKYRVHLLRTVGYTS
jgi:hypothetical protein